MCDRHPSSHPLPHHPSLKRSEPPEAAEDICPGLCLWLCLRLQPGLQGAASPLHLHPCFLRVPHHPPRASRPPAVPAFPPTPPVAHSTRRHPLPTHPALVIKSVLTFNASMSKWAKQDHVVRTEWRAQSRPAPEISKITSDCCEPQWRNHLHAIVRSGNGPCFPRADSSVRTEVVAPCIYGGPVCTARWSTAVRRDTRFDLLRSAPRTGRDSQAFRPAARTAGPSTPTLVPLRSHWRPSHSGDAAAKRPRHPEPMFQASTAKEQGRRVSKMPAVWSSVCAGRGVNARRGR